MRTVYVIDTSFLMDYPDIVRMLGEEYGAHIYIHNASLLELELIKNDKNGQKTPEQRNKANNALREINRTAKTSQEGAYILNKEKDSYFYIDNSSAEHDGMASKGDRRFLGLIAELKKKYAQNDEIVALVIDNSAELQAKQLGAWTISRYKFEPWDILRVQPHATKEELKSAKRNLLQKYHYDKTVSNTDLTAIEKKYAEGKTREINEIFENFEKSNYKKYWLDSDYKYTYKGNGNGGSYSSSSASSNSGASGYSGSSGASGYSSSHSSYSDEEFQREFEKLKKKFRDADYARSNSKASGYSSSSGTSGYSGSSGASGYSGSSGAAGYKGNVKTTPPLRIPLGTLIFIGLLVVLFNPIGFIEEQMEMHRLEKAAEDRRNREVSERANERRAENARRTQEARQERVVAPVKEPVKERETEPARETEPQRSENEEKKKEAWAINSKALETYVLGKVTNFTGFNWTHRTDRNIDMVVRQVVLTLHYDIEDIYNKLVNFLKQKNFIIHSEGIGQITQDMLNIIPEYRLWYQQGDDITFSNYRHAYRIKEGETGKHFIAMLTLAEQNSGICEWGGVIAINLQVYPLSPPIQIGQYPEATPVLIAYRIITRNNNQCKDNLKFARYAPELRSNIRYFISNIRGHAGTIIDVTNSRTTRQF